MDEAPLLSTSRVPASDTYATVGARIGEHLRITLEPRPERPVGGGSISQSHRWKGSSGPLFVKMGPAAHLAMFEAEAEGLKALESAVAVRVPRVLAVGIGVHTAFLALEWIDLVGSPSAGAQLGEQLARQHRKSAESFGWHRDNTIGSTPQINTRMASWRDFFREQRLRFQLELAARQGHNGRLQERGAELLENVDEFFTDHNPQPSLLHGDLWSGNAGVAKGGMPVIFDPAVYYGDREADIAMTRLFGGFSPSFYSAYESAWPLPKSAQKRVDLYNVYHMLNHLNLFGSAYRSPSETMIDGLLAAVGR
jgi:protein-ribulosamine 3-kinase